MKCNSNLMKDPKSPQAINKPIKIGFILLIFIAFLSLFIGDGRYFYKSLFAALFLGVFVIARYCAIKLGSGKESD